MATDTPSPGQPKTEKPPRAPRKKAAAPDQVQRGTRNGAPMGQAQKDALALGREQARAIRLYLEALDELKPKRGRKRTPDSVKAMLERTELELAGGADPLKRVHLLQTKLELEHELAGPLALPTIDHLEPGFIEHASGYSARRGVSYDAWRAAGVPAPVLRKAGIHR